jgi:hypothetical protein
MDQVKLELVVKHLEKSIKKGVVVFCKDQEHYYLTDSYFAIKIKKGYIDNKPKIKGKLISLLGSLDQDISFRTGSKRLLDSNIILPMLDRILSYEYVDSFDSKVLIDNGLYFTRIYNNESKNDFVYLNNKYNDLLDNQFRDTKMSGKNGVLKQDTNDSLLVILGIRINDKESIPALLKGVI